MVYQNFVSDQDLLPKSLSNSSLVSWTTYEYYRKKLHVDLLLLGVKRAKRTFGFFLII